MSAFLYQIARCCSERSVVVILMWLVVLVGLGGLDKALPAASPAGLVLNGTDSAVAQNLLASAFPGSGADASPLLLHSPTVDFGSETGQSLVAGVVADLLGLDQVTSVSGPPDVPDQLSADGGTVLLNVVVAEQWASHTATGEELLSTATSAVAGADVEVALGGLLGQKVSTPDTHSSEILGLLAALAVLFVTLRRVSATLLPLVNALVAVAIGLFLIDLLARLVFIPDVAPTLGTMLGLGVGIDYALFLVTRHRSLLRQGFGVADSAGRTAGTAGAGMVFAGCTLIAALCGLALTGLSFLAWLGFASALVVACAVLSSITLVPAMLGLFKSSVVPRRASELTPEDLDHSVWARLASVVTGHPWYFAVAATVVLVVLAAPAVTLQLGHTDAGVYPPETTARQAYDLTTEAFGPGATAPLAVVVELYAPAQAPEVPGQGDDPREQAATRGGSKATASDPGADDQRRQDPRLLQVQQALVTTPGVVTASDPVVSTDGGVAVFKVIPQWSGADARTEELVATLREETLPEATESLELTGHVGGVTASTSDLSRLIAEKTPWFILGVVSMSFVLLMMAYRSLLIPFKAAVMNLLSIAAAYGVVVAVFQWGWGASLIGLEGPVAIESYVPMMLFAVLFGLSMDYEVFLLTAFREHWERTGDMVVSVRRGLADTGKVVTSAALIMCVVFGSFVLSDNAIVKMFGVGLATAVFVDATVVRCLLVPAIMVLAQKGTWWLPGWLDRLLPQLQVEGDPKTLEAVSKAAGDGPLLVKGSTLATTWAVIGAVGGWVISLLFAKGLGISDPATVGLLLPAAAVSAIAGAFGTTGASQGSHLGRLGGLGAYVMGALAVLLTVSLVTASGDPGRSQGWLVGWAVVALGVTLVAVARRPWATPTLVGAAVMVLALALLAGTPANSSEALLAAICPASLAVAIATIGLRLGRREPVAGHPVDPAPAPEPEPEPEPAECRTERNQVS